MRPDLAVATTLLLPADLDPDLLRASLQPKIFTPELAPLQPWEHLAVQVHGRPASAGTPTANAAAGLAGAGPADAVCNTPAAEAAGQAAAVAASAGTSGAGRKCVFPEDMLGALVQHVQANSTQGIDKLTDQFVESLHGACFSGKLTKKSVRDKIKEITNMKKGRVPCYAVKPEILAVLGLAAGSSPRASPVPTGVWGVRYKEDTAQETPVTGDTAAAAAASPAAADAMQLDDVDVAQQQGQQAAAAVQDPQHVCVQVAAPVSVTAAETQAAAASALSPCVVGVKRPASADPVVHEPQQCIAMEAAEGTSGASAQQQESAAQPTEPAATTAAPPSKKQKTPGSGIERFFMKPKQQQPQQLRPAVAADAGAQHEQQQAAPQQEQHTPPSTPKRPDLDAAQAEQGAAAAAVVAAAAAAHGNHSGVLPMLTPPSVDAADRPSLPRSPVPFRMNAAGEPHEAEQGPGDTEQQKQQHRPPINRWHAQADCRGMGLQGGSTSSMPQQPEQQQECSQPFNGFDQQQHSLKFTRATNLAAAGSGSPAAAGRGGKPQLQVPQLPEGGSAPDSRFWKQLVSRFIIQAVPVLCMSLISYYDNW